MPARFLKKIYLPNSYYHVYNRGAFKIEIFREDQDFIYFLACLREVGMRINISITVYTVMPNHFHLQVHQRASSDMVLLMQSALTRYGMYFSRKYDHSGKVFQGAYKAVLLTSEEKIRENEKYILANPSRAGLKNWLYVGKNLV